MCVCVCRVFQDMHVQACARVCCSYTRIHKAAPYKLLFSSREGSTKGSSRWVAWRGGKEEVKVGVRYEEEDGTFSERMFCQAVAERELGCQLMGHVQCEPRILQLLSPFLPLSAHFSFIHPRVSRVYIYMYVRLCRCC